MSTRWDIFCKVVDNFGDIGVAWRLARILATEHGLDVRLWVDDRSPLARIWPGVSTENGPQRVDAVNVWPWTEPFPEAEPGDVVIETFQCAIPESFLSAMAAKPVKPCWINLDYLSAESWVSGCHRLPSPHPRLPLIKYFYFPGFDDTTGGLLRERSLCEERTAFLGDRETLERFWAWRGLAPLRGAELRVSLFCYPDAPVAELFDVWAGGTAAITGLMPEGEAAERARSALGQKVGSAQCIERGPARLKFVPFTDQRDFDRLLWACDINFVRGEDSFVRAQWAQRPFVWNIYPQGENAHWIKLHAFLDRFGAGLDVPQASAIRHLWRVWNGMVRPAELAQAWGDFLAHREGIGHHSQRWAEQLLRHEELAAGLVNFCADIGKFKVIV
jgi:uncharacterized repeat protein (TIGR03837 family)